MDFDIVEDSRPRFQLQSGGASVAASGKEDRKLSRVQIGACVGVALLLLIVAWMRLAGLLQFLAAWLALALLAGPFAPPSCTGGDCRVGMGATVPQEETETLLPAPAPADTTTERRGQKHGYGSSSRKRTATTDRRGGGGGGVVVVPAAAAPAPPPPSAAAAAKEQEQEQEEEEEGEKEWSGEEIELLKKQLVKHPRGILQRWEVIAEALGGAHLVESVIKMSRLLGEKKFSDGDSYARFVAQRKSTGFKGIIDSPLTQRWEETQTQMSKTSIADVHAKATSKGSKPNNNNNKDGRSSSGRSTGSNAAGAGATRSDWTDVEDKALLSALKAFPKDTAMRWDKVAEAMPGRSKAQCFRRFSDLRETFRSAKTDSSNPGTSSDQVLE